jgi:hypothetical protein
MEEAMSSEVPGQMIEYEMEAEVERAIVRAEIAKIGAPWAAL